MTHHETTTTQEKTMLAAQITQFGTDPSLREVPRPQRGASQTLVRITSAAVGHLDLTIASGNFRVKPDLPHTCGTDGAGIVVESDSFDTGQQVLVRGAGVGLTRPGCWAEFASVPDRAVTPYPDNLPPELAATFLLPTSTGYVAVNDIARVTPGETVIIGGATGAVGSMAAQFALQAGAKRVVGVVPREDMVELLPDDIEPMVASSLQEDCEPWVDVAIDTLGGPHLPLLLRQVRPRGRAALVGYTLGTELVLDLPNWLLADVTLIPVNMISRADRQRELFDELARMLVQGDITLAVDRFPLEQVSDVITRMRSGALRGRAVLMPH